MNYIRAAWWLGIVVMVCMPRAEAGYVFQFSSATAPNNPVANFEMQVGSTLDIQIYVTQTAPSTELSTSGLVGMGFAVNINSPGLEFAGPNAFTFATAFPSAQEVVQSGVNSVRARALTVFDVANVGLVPVTGSSIHLGTVSLRATAASPLGSPFTVLVGDYNPLAVSETEFALFPSNANANVNLDSELFGPNALGTHPFSVTAVPEPSSLWLLGSFSLAIGGFYRWRVKPARAVDSRQVETAN